MLSTFGILTVLTCIVWLAQSLRFVELVATKGLSALVFLEMIFYILPNLIIIVTPIAVLISVVFVYNKLIGDSEMVVMKSVGFSFWQLTKPALLVSALFTVIMYGFTLYLLPVSFTKFREIETSIKSQKNLDILQAGQFSTIGNYTVYLKRKNRNGEVFGIMINDRSDVKKPVTIIAEKGVLVNNDGNNGVVLFNGSTQEKDPKTGRPNILYFEQYTISSLEKKKETYENRHIKHHERFLPELLNPKGENMLESTKMHMLSEAHQRILSPLYCLIFGMIGSAILLLSSHSRRGHTKQIAAITIMCCAYYVSNLFLLNTTKHLILSIWIAYGMASLALLGGLIAILLPAFRRAKQ